MLRVRTEICKGAGHQELQGSAFHAVTETILLQETGQPRRRNRTELIHASIKDIAHRELELSYTRCRQSSSADLRTLKFFQICFRQRTRHLEAR